jgi:hypothetical protein
MNISSPTFCLLFFALISCGAPDINKFRHQSMRKHAHITSCGTWVNGKKTKVIQGNFFNENVKTRVVIEYVLDKNVRLSFYKMISDHWVKSFSDSMPIMYYMCDTILDLNGDGSKELVMQKFRGMGSITDYYHCIYTFKQGHFCKLERIEKFPNMSFQPKTKSFTVLEKSASIQKGKSYRWNRDLSYSLRKMELVKWEDSNRCQKITYIFKNGVPKVLKQSRNEKMDPIYFGFQNWCE